MWEEVSIVYAGLGLDAAYCVQSAKNLTALAAHPKQRRNRAMNPYLIAAIPAVGIIIVLLSIFAYLNGRKSRQWKSKRMKLMQRYELLSSTTGLAFFSLLEIKESTGNFAASNVIGEGGFNIVYRGTLPNGSPIGVKRIKDSMKIKGGTDFSHELHVISRIKHCNLLPLRGYCVEFNKDRQVSEQLLVSDLLENGSLAYCLFDSNRSTCLSWPERYKIAVGIARGLTYLHEFSKLAIIHRDVKAVNVLLDSHLINAPIGTLGYVAPEYALYDHLTNKSDVFSFDIILLELITGRRAMDSTCGVLEHFLLSDWVIDMTQKKLLAIDKVLLLALQCAHPRVVSRPSILETLLTLEAIDGPL